MTVGIGASVVDGVQRFESTAQRFGLLSAQIGVEPGRAAFPSLIRSLCEGTGASRVVVSLDIDDRIDSSSSGGGGRSTDDDDNDDSDSVARAVVRSITMDLALSLASNQPCRNRLHHADRCDCVAVVLFKPLLSNENDSFPMLCHGSDEYILEEEEGNTNKDQEPRNRRTMSPSQPTQSQQRAMRRIQIRHVTGMNDILSYLLLVCGLPVDQHPLGGIFIDGLDCIDGGRTVDAATLTLRQTQIVALMVDTAHCLQRLYNGNLPLVLVTLHDGCRRRDANSQRNSRQFVSASSFWAPLQLQVRQRNTGHDKAASGWYQRDTTHGPHHDTGTSAVVSSQWMVTTPDIKSTVAISILKHWEKDESYVVWNAK